MLGRRAVAASLSRSVAPTTARVAAAVMAPSTPLVSPACSSAEAVNLQLPQRRCFSAEAEAAPALEEVPVEALIAAAPVTDRDPKIPANYYAPQHVQFSGAWFMFESDPAKHTYGSVGRYFPLGGSRPSATEKDREQSVAAVFPGGLAGDLSNEFAVTNTNMMCVRPTGVYLVQALEHWRQTTGRRLAAEGKPVLDLDPSTPYKAPDLVKDLDLLSVDGVKPVVSSSSSSSASSSSSSASSSSSSSSSSTTASSGSSSSDKKEKATMFVGNENPLDSFRRPKASSSTGPYDWSKVDLDPFKPGAVPPYRMLTGPRGIGKSALLNYCVAYARHQIIDPEEEYYNKAQQWISVFLPDSFKVMKKGLVLVPSKRRPGKVDQHDIALGLLRDTLLANRTTLSKVKQRGKYASFRYLPRQLDAVVSVQREELRKKEEAEKAKLKAQADAAGTAWNPASYKSKYEDESDTTSVDRSTFTLADMAEWGLQHPSFATDALCDLLDELKQVTEFPVLIAVDGHNLLYDSPTVYPDQQGSGRLLKPEELSVPAAFQCLDEKGLKDSFKMARGVYLTTVTQKHARPMRMFAVCNVPEEQRLRVPEATREEVAAQLKHYTESNAFLMLPGGSAGGIGGGEEGMDVDAFAVEYYRTLSSGRFAEVYNAATLQA